MRFALPFLLFASVSVTVSCKDRKFNNPSEQKDFVDGAYTSKTPDQLTFGFHWTSSATVTDLNSAIQWAKFQIDESKENAKIPENGPAPTNAMAGHGLYIATDPIQSKDFGSNLLLVPIKPQSKYSFVFDRGGSSQFTAMRSNIPMIVYQYTNSFVPGADNKSAVIRSPDVVDWEKASFYAFKQGTLEVPDATGIEKLKLALDSKDIKQFLEYFLNSRKTLESICALVSATQLATFQSIKSNLSKSFIAAFSTLDENKQSLSTVILKELKEPAQKELVEKQPLSLQPVLLQTAEKWQNTFFSFMFGRMGRILYPTGASTIPGDSEVTFDFDIFTLKKLKMIPQDSNIKTNAELLDYLFTAEEKKLKAEAESLSALKPIANQFSLLLAEMSIAAWQ